MLDSNMEKLFFILAVLFAYVAIIAALRSGEKAKKPSIKITAKISGAFYMQNDDSYNINLIFKISNLGQADFEYSGFWVASPIPSHTVSKNSDSPNMIRAHESAEYAWAALTKNLILDKVFLTDLSEKEWQMPQNSLQETVDEVNKRIRYMEESRIHWFDV